MGRRFNPPALDQLWVADFTYVPTWSGMVYVAFVIDACSRRILGWRAATRMRTELVLDALEHAVWTRVQAGSTELGGLIMHTGAGSQYTSIAYPSASPSQEPHRLSGPSATPMTTLWPSRPSGCSRPS